MTEEPTKQRTRESSLSELLSPTLAESQAGIRGITLEDEVVTARELRARKRRRHTIMATALSVFAVVLIVLGVIFVQRYDINPFKNRDYSGAGNGEPVSFTIEQGESTAQIAQALKEKDIIADPGKFIDVYQKEANGKTLKAGTYELQKQMSSSSVVKNLVDSDNNIFYIAVQQGKRMNETVDIIAKATEGKISRRDIEAAMSHPEEYGIPKNFPSMEGWLHPGEYRIPKEGTDAKKIIEAMVSRTKADLQEAGVSGDQRTFEVLTKASIVELEAQPKDYVAVAGIINNRLNNPKGETNGLIQSDATVTYGLGVRSYHLTEEQKADKNNKYNTYANTGLPAGPIASPGLSSIKAVANPENNPYYYWVTVDLDTGETKYSRTYKEHQKYVDEYNQWCEEHSGRCK